MRAVGGLDHLMHAEEAARGLDPAASPAATAPVTMKAQTDERRKARRTRRCNSIRPTSDDQRDLERQFRR